MEMIGSTTQLFTTSFVVAMGLFVTLWAGSRFGLSRKRSLLIYAWHSMFCVLYVLYTIANGADAQIYYMKALSGELAFSLGTKAVVSLTTLLVNGLNLSFLGACLLFNIFGTIGLQAFDASLQSACADKSRLMRRFATLIVFLPSISFWSSALGKDSLSFMAAGITLWSVIGTRPRVAPLVFAITVMLVVRPHIAGLMVGALAGSLIVQRKIPLVQRIIFGFAAFAAAAVMIPLAMNYAGLGEEAGTDELMEYVEERQSHNTQGGSSIDIASMSPPMQLFSYLFRPMPIEARSVFALAASADNLVLLILFVGGMAKILSGKRRLPGNRSFLWIYSVSTWMILAVTTANMGIAVRQKWMFAPMLIYLFVSVLGRRRQAAGRRPVLGPRRVGRLQAVAQAQVRQA